MAYIKINNKVLPPEVVHAYEHLGRSGRISMSNLIDSAVQDIIAKVNLAETHGNKTFGDISNSTLIKACLEIGNYKAAICLISPIKSRGKGQVIRNEVVEKLKDIDEATAYLTTLSANTHRHVCHTVRFDENGNEIYSK